MDGARVDGLTFRFNEVKNVVLQAPQTSPYWQHLDSICKGSTKLEALTAIIQTM